MVFAAPKNLIPLIDTLQTFCQGVAELLHRLTLIKFYTYLHRLHRNLHTQTRFTHTYTDFNKQLYTDLKMKILTHKI